MAAIYRPTYHSPVYEPARYFTKKGQQLVRFTLPRSGELVTGELLPNGKAKLTSPYYFARIKKNGKTCRVKLGVTDKLAAEQLAARLQLDAQHQRAGIIDPLAKHRASGLWDHIRDYRVHLEAASDTGKHIKETVSILHYVRAYCDFDSTEDFSATALNTYLAAILRRKRHNSYRTRNKHLKAVKALVHWMMRTDRLAADPFRTIGLLNEEADPNKRTRRALTKEELTKIIKAAEKGSDVQCVTGSERAILYLVAASTGIRAGELADLYIRDVSLTAEVPHIVVSAKIAKRRKLDVAPLHPLVAKRLQLWLDDRKAHPNARLFNLLSIGGGKRDTAAMMRKDCKAAGVEYVNDFGIADFHAMRTSFITSLCRSTDQFTAMRLARHSTPTLTAKHYDKQQLIHRSEAVAALPLLKA